MGHSWSGTLQVSGAHVLPKRSLRRCCLRYHTGCTLNYLAVHSLLTIAQSSLDKAKSWVKELQRQANENIIIALAGNKKDIVDENPDKRAIPTTDAEAYAKESGLLFFETSAKTSNNVRELFTAIAKKLPLDQAGPRNLRANPRTGPLDLRAADSTGQQGAGNCNC